MSVSHQGKSALQTLLSAQKFVADEGSRFKLIEGRTSKVVPAILQELASAAVLLELMIRPALFFKEWATMGPLSRTMAEGNGGTIAQVALMIHSLDGVLDYEGLQSVKESSKKKRVR